MGGTLSFGTGCGGNGVRSRAGKVVAGVGAVALLAAAAGCRPPLFSPNEERSQYDRYDAIRDQRAPHYIEDEFGYRRPNLRGRLLPKE